MNSETLLIKLSNQLAQLYFYTFKSHLKTFVKLILTIATKYPYSKIVISNQSVKLYPVLLCLLAVKA